MPKGGQSALDSLAQVTGLFQLGKQLEVWLPGQALIEASPHWKLGACYCLGKGRIPLKSQTPDWPARRHGAR